MPRIDDPTTLRRTRRRPTPRRRVVVRPKPAPQIRRPEITGHRPAARPKPAPKPPSPSKARSLAREQEKQYRSQGRAVKHEARRHNQETRRQLLIRRRAAHRSPTLFGDPVRGLKRSERRGIKTLAKLRASDPERYKRNLRRADDTHVGPVNVSAAKRTLDDIPKEAAKEIGKAAESAKNYIAKHDRNRGNPQYAGTFGSTKTATEVIDLVANAPTSTYLTADAAVDSAFKHDNRKLSKLWKDYKKSSALSAAVSGNFKEAAKRAEDHPITTALELSGAKAAVGRSAGALARHAPSKRVRQAASTERPNLKLYPEGYSKHGPEIEREYSRDLINKGVQVYGERRVAKGSRVRKRGKHAGTQRRPGRDPHRDYGTRHAVALPKRMGGSRLESAASRPRLVRRTDTRVEAQNRVSQARKTQAEHDVRRIVHKRNAAGVQLAAEGYARLDRVRDDLRKRRLHLARERQGLKDPLRLRLNRDEAKHIRELEALPDDKLARVVEGAQEFAGQQKSVQERGRRAGAYTEVGQSKRFYPALQSHIRRPAGEERRGLSPEDIPIAAKVLQRRARRGKSLPKNLSAQALNEVRRRERSSATQTPVGLAAAVARTALKRVPARRAHKVTPAEFEAAFSKAKSAPRGSYLSDYVPAERAKQTLLLSEDGKAGVAVKPDGDIVSVFRLPGAEPGTGRAMVRAAVAHGGHKLDAIGDDLRALYEAEGFHVTKTVPWDDRFAPPGWDYASQGRPNIYFMEYSRPHGRGASSAAGTVRGRANGPERRANAGAGAQPAGVGAGVHSANVPGLGRPAGRPGNSGDSSAAALRAAATRRPRVGQARGVTQADFGPGLARVRRRVRVPARPLSEEELATSARVLQRRERRGKEGLSGHVEGGPVLVTHRPGKGRTSARLQPAAPFEPMKSRSGRAGKEGSREVGRGALERQAVTSEAQVTAAEGFQLLDREFGIPAGSGGRRYAETRDKALERARELTLDPETGLLKPDAMPLVPVNIAQFHTFGARLRAKQEQGMPRSYAAINDIERQALNDTWHAALNESGRGKWILLPEDVASRLAEHMSVGNFGPLHSITNTFKDIVLTSSSPARWLGGNVTDLAMRTAFAGITPLDIARGRMIVRNAAKRGLQGEQAAASVAGGGFFHANTALSRAMRPRGHEEHIARTVLSAPWRAWKGAVFSLEHMIEELPQYGAVGKAAGREMHRFEDGRMKASLKSLLKLQDKQIDHFAERLANDRALEARIQKATEDVIGRWGKISPNMRRAMLIAPFAQWLGAAVRYVFVTLPVHHPIKSALIAGMSEMTQEERKKLGLSYYAERQNQVQDYQMGSIPTSIGSNKYGPVVRGVRTGHMTSFGTAAQAASGDVGSFLLPQFAGALDAWAGTSFTNEPLVYPDWWPEPEKRRLPIPPDERFKIGLGALLESSVPFASAFRRAVIEKGRPSEPFSTILTPATRKKFDKQTNTYVENKGTTLGGILEWLSPVPPPQRLYTYGTGKAIEEQGITGETLERWRKLREQQKQGDIFTRPTQEGDERDLFAPKNQAPKQEPRDIFAP